MQVNIQSVKFDATEQLQQFINKKVANLEKMCSDIISIDVTLSITKRETINNKEVKIIVNVPKKQIAIGKICDTFEEAVASAVESAEVQLIKYKEKLAD